MALSQGRVAVIDALLSVTTDPSAKDAEGSTPLHRATGRGYTSAAVSLIAGGRFNFKFTHAVTASAGDSEAQPE